MRSPFSRLQSRIRSGLHSPIFFETAQKAKKWWEKLHIWHYIVRVIVLLICLVGCFWQTSTIIELYLSYPTTVSVFAERMQHLETPGITICNNNRLLLSKMREINQTFSRHWQHFMKLQSSDNYTLDVNLRIQTLIDNTMRYLIEKTPISEFMSYGEQYESFIPPDEFKCAADEQNPDRPCRNFANVISTAQNEGNCFTLFHHSSKKVADDVAVKAGLSSNPVLKGSENGTVDIELSERPFQPNEVVRLKVNFNAAEYTKLNEPVSGSVVIHDSNVAPSIRQKSFTIMPGNYYEFFLVKDTTELLPFPYATDCQNYTTLNAKHYFSVGDEAESSDMIYKYPFSRENCLIGCMSAQTLKLCKCWPPELPFIPNKASRATENQVKWCDWGTIDNLNVIFNGTDHVLLFNYCFQQHEELCGAKCKSSCKTDRYSVNVVSRTWPADERISHSKRKDYFDIQRNCCAIISVRFYDAEHTILRYQPKFEPIELMSYLSGIISMWLGFSVLGMFKVFETAIEKIVYLIQKKKNAEQQSPATQRWQQARVKLSAVHRLGGSRGRTSNLLTTDNYITDNHFKNRNRISDFKDRDYLNWQRATPLYIYDYNFPGVRRPAAARHRLFNDILNNH